MCSFKLCPPPSPLLPQSKSLSYAYESILSLVDTSFLYCPYPSTQLPGECLSGRDPSPQSVLSKIEAKDTEVLPSLCQCGQEWEEQVGAEGEEVGELS